MKKATFGIYDQANFEPYHWIFSLSTNSEIWRHATLKENFLFANQPGIIGDNQFPINQDQS